MGRREKATKNSVLSVVYIVSISLMAFVVRKFFLLHLSVDYLGISSTLSNVLGFLALADLGFAYTATYNLYKPFKEGNTEQINAILFVLKRLFTALGIFILCFGIIMSGFIRFFLKGVEINATVYLIYYLLLINSVASYFLSYIRTAYLASLRGYIPNVVDLVVTQLCNILKIVAIIWFESFILYTAIAIVNTVLSNLILLGISKKYFPFIDLRKMKKEDEICVQIEKTIKEQLKDVFGGKLAGYAYGSTDSIVISTFANTVSVGFLSNYMQIATLMRQLISYTGDPITPILGNMVLDNDSEKNIECFQMFNLIMYWIACVLLVPAALLSGKFVSAVYGDAFVLPFIVVICIVADLLISALHFPVCSYITACGLFKQEKVAGITAAALNIGTSVILTIQLGYIGALIGTVISQAVIWIMRSHYVIAEGLKPDRGFSVKYGVRSVEYLVLFVVQALLGFYLCRLIPVHNKIVNFIVCGFLLEIMVLLFNVAVFCKNRLARQTFEKFYGVFRNRLGK